MQIYYDSEYADELTEKIYKKFMESIQNRDKVHLSDLTRCPVKCWCRLSGIKPLPFSSRSVGMMMIGMVGQEIIQAIYPSEWAEFEPDSDIPSHIDVYVQEKERFPLEIKWSRKSIYGGSGLPEAWVLQCTGYMSLVNEQLGRFAILDIMNARINAFKIKVTQEELDTRRKQLDDGKALILKAVDEKNPFILPVKITECKYCDYRDTRTRTKKKMGRGCPRYKDRKTANLELFLSSSEE
jgi:hypothetical protein